MLSILLTAVAAVAVAVPPADDAALLRAHQESARERVAALAGRVEALPDGPERRELQAEIVRVKQESQIELLQLAAALARARGDEAGAAEAERLLEMLLAPAVPATAEAAPKPSPRS